VRYLSVCSGIEAATVAWHPLGWTAAAYSEIEKFPSQVLAHHYPDVPNVGDMTKFKEWNIGPIDLLVGGTPCQSFSVAGLRKGLDDPRGNLMLTFLAIADQHRPRWLVWENVPGVLSSNGGKDFGTFLGALGELGYGFSYRILDAQFFGVAQRRRRVFVVGCLGDWRAAAAVLFERHSLSGDSAPSREKRKEVASATGMRLDVSLIGSLTAGFGKVGAPEVDAYTCLPAFTSYGIPGNWIGRKPENGGNATEPMHDIAPCLTKADQHGVAQPIAFSGQMSTPQTDVEMTQTLQAKNPMAVAVGTDLYNCSITGDVSMTLKRGDGNPAINQPTVMQPVGAFKPGQSAQAHSIGYENEMAPTLEAGSGGNNKPAVHHGMAVRRLTPVECERLQGFPDNYTDIQPKGKATPDGPRYKALGNSMAVPVMAWIGKRIQEVEKMQCKPNK
jgi:DNA (cytosine-5)-methyltransferase 1